MYQDYEIPKDLRFKTQDIIRMHGLKCSLLLNTKDFKEELDLVKATLKLSFSVLSKEIGKKWTAISCLVQILTAYIISFVTYKIANYFIVYGVGSGLISLFCFVMLTSIIVIVSRSVKGKKFCKFCPKRKSCRK